MKKIQIPACKPSELFEECVQGISDASLQKRLVAQHHLLEIANTAYVTNSAVQTWCHLPRAKYAHPEQIIVGDLTKGELVALYDKGMVGANGSARKNTTK